MKAILLFSLLLLPSLSWAADPCTLQTYSDPKVEPNYDCPSPHEDSLVPRLELKTSVNLKVKEPAPWAGVLMDKERVIVLGLRVKALRRLRWQDMRTAEGKLSNELGLAKATSKAALNLAVSQRDNYKEQTKALQEEVIRLNKWYHSKVFWFSVGFITAAAGATALAYGLRK